MEEIVKKESPDIILSLGQAGNSPYIHVERVAINMDNGMYSDGTAVLADSAGVEKVDSVIFPEGENAYFSTLPVWDLIRKVNEAGIGCRASYSAGTYVCNHVMYVGAYLASKSGNMISGFVHVPFLPEQPPVYIVNLIVMAVWVIVSPVAHSQLIACDEHWHRS